MVGVVLAVMGCSDSKSTPDGRKVAALIERCIGTAPGEEAIRFVGMTEAKLTKEAIGENLTVRILNRGDECLARTDDLRPNRVNALLIDGTVVWARRF